MSNTGYPEEPYAEMGATMTGFKKFGMTPDKKTSLFKQKAQSVSQSLNNFGKPERMKITPMQGYDYNQDDVNMDSPTALSYMQAMNERMEYFNNAVLK